MTLTDMVSMEHNCLYFIFSMLFSTGCTLSAVLSTEAPSLGNSIQIVLESEAALVSNPLGSHVRYKILANKEIKASSLAVDDFIQLGSAQGLVLDLKQGSGPQEFILDVFISARAGTVELSLAEGAVEFEDSSVNLMATSDKATRTQALAENHLVNTYDASCYIDSIHAIRCFGSYAFSGSLLGNNSVADYGRQYISKPVITTLVPGLVHFQKISSGVTSICALNHDGKIYCWGENDNYQLGLGDATTSSAYIPTPIVTAKLPGDQTFIDISVGSWGAGACAISSGYDLYCWGNVNPASGGVPTKMDLSSLGFGMKVSQVTVGDRHACSVTRDARIFCWGSNSYGQLGNGSLVDSLEPQWVDVSSMIGSNKFVNATASNYGHSCGVTSDGDLYCWGSNSSGSVGDGTDTDRTVPTMVDKSNVPSSEFFVRVDSANEANCALSNKGQAYCFGANWFMNLGDGTYDDSNIPLKVSMGNLAVGSYFTSVSLSERMSCGRLNTHGIACWGEGDNYVSFKDLPEYKPVELPKVSGQAWSQVAMGRDSYLCALTNDGTGYCWGRGPFNMSDSGANFFSTPTPIPTSTMSGSTKFSYISTGNRVICGVSTDGILYCWGSGVLIGQGDPLITTVDKPTPVVTNDMVGETTFTQVSIGDSVACGVATDGKGYCWGGGSDSTSKLIGNTVLGNGLPSQVRFAPYPIKDTNITGAKTFSKILVSTYHACGLMTDSKVYCWGSKKYGSSHSSGAVSSQPVALDTSGMTGSQLFKDIHGNKQSFCGVSLDNIIYCWGDNYNGQLGNGSTVTALAPVPIDVSGLASAMSSSPLVRAFGRLSCGILDVDKNLYCWGIAAPMDYTTAILSPQLIDTQGIDGTFVSLESIRGGDMGGTVIGITTTGKMYCIGVDCKRAPRPFPTLQLLEGL